MEEKRTKFKEFLFREARTSKGNSQNRGITLIALIITIIILLILAGITITQTTQSGLFDKTKEAKNKAQQAENTENEILKDYINKIDDYINDESKIKDYIITFNANDGVIIDDEGNTSTESTKTVTFGSTYGELPIPTKEGYSFLGWFTASSNGEQILPETKVTTAANDQVLYAQWKEIQKLDLSSTSSSGTVTTTVINGKKATGIPQATWNGYKSTYSNNRAVCTKKISLANKISAEYQAVGIYITLPSKSSLFKDNDPAWLYQTKIYTSTLEVYIDDNLCGSTTVTHGTAVNKYDISFDELVTINSSSVIKLSFNKNTYFYSGFGTGYNIGAWYCESAYRDFALKLLDK